MKLHNQPPKPTKTTELTQKFRFYFALPGLIIIILYVCVCVRVYRPLLLCNYIRENTQNHIQHQHTTRYSRCHTSATPNKKPIETNANISSHTQINLPQYVVPTSEQSHTHTQNSKNDFFEICRSTEIAMHLRSEWVLLHYTHTHFPYHTYDSHTQLTKNDNNNYIYTYIYILLQNK